jgi:hypothetical protein
MQRRKTSKITPFSIDQNMKAVNQSNSIVLQTNQATTCDAAA